MVRLVALVLVAVALGAAAPAQADPLTVGVETTVATTVEQTTTTVAGVVPAVSSEAATPKPVQTVAETAGSAAESAKATAPTTAAPPPPTSAPAQPGVETPSPSSRALSSTRDRGPVRALRAGRDRVTASHPAAAHESGPVAAETEHPVARGAGPDAPRAAAAPDGRQAQDSPAPQAGAGTASAAAASFLFGGVALLAGALMLAAPRVVRRLDVEPAPYRPVVLASSLERPG
jgi:hypothetical protein